MNGIWKPRAHTMDGHAARDAVCYHSAYENSASQRAISPNLIINAQRVHEAPGLNTDG